MRKIEQDLLDAIHSGRALHSRSHSRRNTTYNPDTGEVRLFDNVIANTRTRHWTMAGYPTVTTRSRLNALLPLLYATENNPDPRVYIQQRRGQQYLTLPCGTETGLHPSTVHQAGADSIVAVLRRDDTTQTMPTDTTALYDLRAGDGNDGTYRLCTLRVPASVQSDAALKFVAWALTVNRFITGTKTRNFLMRNEPHADLTETETSLVWDHGPNGETAFGGAWRVVDLVKVADASSHADGLVHDLIEWLDVGALRFLNNRLRAAGLGVL